MGTSPARRAWALHGWPVTEPDNVSPPAYVELKPDPSRMRHLLSLVLLLAGLATTGAAGACERHLQGHQTGSDTNSEASQR